MHRARIEEFAVGAASGSHGGQEKSLSCSIPENRRGRENPRQYHQEVIDYETWKKIS